jgi:hypothetical protein
MSYDKSEKIESGIWRLNSKRGYVVEVDLGMDRSGKRIRRRRTFH